MRITYAHVSAPPGPPRPPEDRPSGWWEFHRGGCPNAHPAFHHSEATETVRPIPAIVLELIDYPHAPGDQDVTLRFCPCVREARRETTP